MDRYGNFRDPRGRFTSGNPGRPPVTKIRLSVFLPEKIRGVMAQVTSAIGGDGPDFYGVGEAFWSAVAFSLFNSIYSAFIIKSHGGSDELGIRWKDVTPETKAYNRPKERLELSLPGPKRRPTLTPEQDQAWRLRFARLYKKLANHMGEETAKDISAGYAWNWVKANMGAWTLIGTLGIKKVDILNRTGALQNSLFPEPLVGDSYVPGDPNQLYEMRRGSLTIGTKLDYAVHVDKTRTIWPASIDLWMDRAVSAGRDKVYDLLPDILQAEAT